MSKLKTKVAELVKCIDRVQKALYWLEVDRTDLKHRCNKLEKQVENSLYVITPPDPTILKRLETLECQVQCGINGHKWVLQSVFMLDEHTTNETTIGDFLCEHCNAEMARDLTAEEVKAAKKLGF